MTKSIVVTPSMGPKITPSDIEANIVKVQYQVFEGRLTICVITLKNGFLVTGESSCVDAANFNKELGEQFAKEQAIDKIWGFMGYALRDKLYGASSE